MLFTKTGALFAVALTLAHAEPGNDKDHNKPKPSCKPGNGKGHGHGHGHGNCNGDGNGNGDGGKKPPNIVLILTDDQDKRTTMHREYLPRIYEHLVDEGVMYENFFAPVSLCCPSRVSLLRAQHAHNHNVTFVDPPYGGYVVFNDLGYHGHTLADFLQQAGYDTYYVGKYMNQHTVENCVSLPVSGFTSSSMAVDPWTYDYWSPGFSTDNQEAVVTPGVYHQEMSVNKTLAYLDRALENDKPFFVAYSPLGPHSWATGEDLRAEGAPFFNVPQGPPHAAAMFPDTELPRVDSWNPDEPMGVSWVKTLPKLNRTQEAYFDDFYRGRLRSLQPVDEFVETLINRLTAAGELDNTYIMFTSDNGYAIGTHRRNPGKTLGMDDDINVPLVIRGPGMTKGKVDTVSLYNMVDLSRTIMDLAGAKTDYENDGVMMNLHQEGDTNDYSAARHSISEYWIKAIEEGIYFGEWRENNTYRTLRVNDEETNHSLSYSVWCTGEREMYDLTEDPSQARNLLAPLNNVGEFAAFDAKGSDGNVVLSEELQKTANRLDGLLLVLKNCKGDTCRLPYAAMFASVKENQPKSFGDTLDPKYDAYFSALPKVQFSTCTLGYHLRIEQPVWEDNLAY